MIMGVFQNIVINHLDELTDRHHLSYHQTRTMKKIQVCHTQDSGFSKEYTCDLCGKTYIHYSGCGNRNCPECQHRNCEEWADNYEKYLLDGIAYFHLVFTFPSELNPLFYQNQDLLYPLMYDASKRALIDATKEDYGKTGFTFILHTWGSDLNYHPHIHGIVAGGGITTDDEGNQIFRKAPDNFLVSVKVLSKLLRGKFIDSLNRLYRKGKLTLTGKCEYLTSPDDFNSFISDLYEKEWVVNSKPSFKNVKAVVNYIGRYTHRIAISNSRIINYDGENGKVTFRYKSYRSNGKMKEMTLDAIEFLRRFSMHILPSHFLKVRHYGFMANAQRKTMTALCRKLLGIHTKDSGSSDDDESNVPSSPLFECLCPECFSKLKKIGFERHHSLVNST